MSSTPDAPSPAPPLGQPPVGVPVAEADTGGGTVAAPQLVVAPPAPEPGAPAAPGYRPDARYVLMLGSLTALPAISTDMYLPSLPDVARDLHTTATGAQLTLTAMMLGGAVGQLVIGPLSDRFGRRRPALSAWPCTCSRR